MTACADLPRTLSMANANSPVQAARRTDDFTTPPSRSSHTTSAESIARMSHSGGSPSRLGGKLSRADCRPQTLAPSFVVSPTRAILDRRSLTLYFATRFTRTTRIAGENLRYPLVNAKSRGLEPRLFALVGQLWQGVTPSGVSCWMRERLGARPPSGALGAGWSAKSLRFERDLGRVMSRVRGYGSWFQAITGPNLRCRQPVRL